MPLAISNTRIAEQGNGLGSRKDPSQSINQSVEKHEPARPSHPGTRVMIRASVSGSLYRDDFLGSSARTRARNAFCCWIVVVLSFFSAAAAAAAAGRGGEIQVTYMDVR